MEGNVPRTERRRNHRLRAIFDEACRLVAPCYELPPRRLPREWLVFHTARAAYPQLSPLDLFQFTMASRRVFLGAAAGHDRPDG